MTVNGFYYKYHYNLYELFCCYFQLWNSESRHGTMNLLCLYDHRDKHVCKTLSVPYQLSSTAQEKSPLDPCLIGELS